MPQLEYKIFDKPKKRESYELNLSAALGCEQVQHKKSMEILIDENTTTINRGQIMMTEKPTMMK